MSLFIIIFDFFVQCHTFIEYKDSVFLLKNKYSFDKSVQCHTFIEYNAYLFTYYGGDDAARAAVMAVLAEVDALPCAEVEAVVGYGDGEAYA